MSKMTVIQLLNKIANGEETSKKIKYKDIIFDYKKEKGDYESEEGQFFLDWVELNKYGLHDEVEIIEEDKKIEKLETYDIAGNIFLEDCCFKYIPIDKEKLTANEQVFADKINEIIDYIMENK